MTRNRRFPRATLADLNSPLGDLKQALMKTAAIAPDVSHRGKEVAGTEINKAATLRKNSGPKPKLKQAYLERLNAPTPEIAGSQPPSIERPKPPKRAPVSKPITKPAQAPEPKHAPIDPAKRRRQAAQQVRELVGASTPSIEERPQTISSPNKDEIDRAISAGADILQRRPEPDDDGYIIGFDFGTSSVKIAYRQPYVANDPVAVIAVPRELRSADHPGLWQSVVWYEPRAEKFSLYPIESAVALDGFKTGLIAGNGAKAMPQAPSVTKAEAATAFLALQFAHMIGAYAINQPLGPAGADHFVLINIGIPVAVRDDKRAFSEFSRVVAAAYKLASVAPNFSLSIVKKELADAPTALPEFLQLVPELTAAIAGYATDPMVQLGAHLLVDVGASTLDLVAFNLQAQLKASVFTAGVDLFGAGALKVARETGLHDDVFSQACFHLFYEVYGKAKADHRAPSLFKPGRRRHPVQLVITGGGCDSSVHNRFINSLPREQVLGDMALKRPSPPGRIMKEEGDRSRLLLAYGLTRDVTELHQLRLPSEIEDLPPSAGSTLTPWDKDF